MFLTPKAWARASKCWKPFFRPPVFWFSIPNSARRSWDRGSGSGPSPTILSCCCTKSTGTGSLSRSEEHTSELQSLMLISYVVFCLKEKKNQQQQTTHIITRVSRLIAKTQD